MPQTSQALKLITKVSMFEGLPSGALEKLADQCSIEKMTAGDVLFWEGSPGQAFFLLEQGDIKIFKTAPDGREIVLKLLTSGSMFGEVILFENPTYPVSATALTPTELVKIPRPAFLSLLDDEGLRNAFIGRLMEKQRQLTDRLLYLTAYDVEERFVRFLVERYGANDEMVVDLSKKEIAALIGTIPETFSRLINRLKVHGNLTWAGSHLRFSSGYLASFMLEDD